MPVNRLAIDAIAQPLSRGATVLVPSNRLRDIVSHAYADWQAGVYRTPQVLGIDVWITRLWQRAGELGLAPYSRVQALSSSEEIFIWIEIIEESLEELPLLNPEETANSVSRAYQLMKQWRLDQDHLQVLESYRVIPDIAAFLDWSSRFERRCQQRAVASLSDCLVQINADLESGVALPLAEEFLLLNFYEPPPLYAELFEKLKARTRLSTHLYEYPQTQATGKRYEFTSQRDEFTYIAHWARARLAMDDEAHIGIIGELDEKQRTQLHHVLASTLDDHYQIQFDATHTRFNTSHSTRNLTQEAVIHDAFLILNLLREEQVSENICRLLRSPFVLADSGETSQRHALERYMRRNLSDRCLSHEISSIAQRRDRDYSCPALAVALLSVREQSRRLGRWESPRTWSRLFSKVLQAFNWPGGRLTPPQAQLLKRWDEALERLAGLSAVTGKLDLGKAIACLRNLCVRSRQTRTFDNKCQISQYSLEEAAGLAFDHLWIVNCNDQVWPPSVRANPFLPYSLQRDQKIPGSHSDIQHSMATGTFTMLCNAVSQELCASHHASDGDQEFRPSSFIAAFELAQTDQAIERQSQQSAHPAEYRTLNTVADSEFVPLQADSQSLGGHQVLSDQSSCPFRAFALHRLHAEPLEPFESGLSKMARGSAMHRALETLYQELHSAQQLRQLSDEALDSLCHKSATEAIGWLRSRHLRLMTPRFEKIEHDRIQILLKRFLLSTDAEQGRADFQVLGREQRHQWQYEGMHFNLVIDRIDQLADGSLAVIDYKTGKSAPANSSWLDERPEDMQLPFYYTVMSSQQPAPVNAVAIAHLNAAKIAYTGLAADPGFHAAIKPSADDRYVRKDWAELATEFPAKVATIAREFKAGCAVVDPVKGALTCRYCALENLCRIDELSKADTDAGESLL